MDQRPTHASGTVSTNKRITPSTVHLTIKTKERHPFKPGQFAWITKTEEGKKYKRPYSIVSAPWEGELAFCIKNIPEGQVSPKLCTLKLGEQVDVLLPLGLFVLPEEEPDEYVLISTGTGIAPYRSMIRTLFSKHVGGPQESTEKKVTLLCGFRTAQDALYHEEWLDLAAKEPLFTYQPTLSREEKEGFSKGRVQEHLEKMHTCTKTKYYVCGLSEMVLHVKEELIRLGVKKEQLHMELYG